MKTATRLIALCALGGALFATSGASAYQLIGWDWSWQPTPIDDPILINTGSFPSGAAADIEAAWQAAMDEWTNNGGAPTFSFLNGGQTNQTSWTADGTHIGYWHATTTGATIALTQSWGWGSNVSDCDIRFYGDNGFGTIWWSFDPAGPAWFEMDFQLIAEHELGHCAGLDHSGNSNAVMFGSAGSGTSVNARQLHNDDKLGLQAMYGSGGNANLLLNGASFVDNGDGDGLLEPGETIDLVISVDNDAGAPALAAQADASNPGPDLTLLSTTAWPATDPDHAPYTVDDYLGITVEVDPGCTLNGVGTVDIDLSATNFGPTTTPLELPLFCDDTAPLVLTLSTPWVAGQPATVTVTGALPGETVYVGRTTDGTTVDGGPCPGLLGGLCLDITGAVTLWDTLTADVTGTAVLSFTVPSGPAPGTTLYVQAAVARGVGGNQSAESNVGIGVLQ